MTPPTVRVLQPASTRAEVSAAKTTAGDASWRIELQPAVPAGAALTLELAHAVREPAAQLRVDVDGAFAGGYGELWFPQTCDASSFVTGRLRVVVPDDMTVIATGARVGAEGAGAAEFEISAPAKLAFAAARYEVMHGDGELPLATYMRRSRPTDRAVLDGAQAAVDALSAVFGPLGASGIALVEVDYDGDTTTIGGASEHGMIFSDPSYLDGGFVLAYWAHELGHQWWPLRVRTRDDSPGAMLFSEGLAQFGALRAVTAIEGEASARRFRREGYPGYPGRQSTAGYLALLAEGCDRPLLEPIASDAETAGVQHALANSKGFLVLEMLAQRIGPVALAQSLTAFQAAHGGGESSWLELQAHLERDAGEPLAWFFEQWLTRPGAPKYDLDWTQAGAELTVRVGQDPPTYRARLELEVRGRKGVSMRRELEIVGDMATLTVAVPFRVTDVTLDPEHRVLRRAGRNAPTVVPSEGHRGGCPRRDDQPRDRAR